MLKTNLAIVIALIIVFFASSADAASRKFISSLSVKNKGDFKFWSKDSKPLRNLVDYVDVTTNPNSSDFIPQNDRIAVFDLDGTLMCETDPFCLDYFMFIYRACYDESFVPSKEDRELAKSLEECIKAGNFRPDLGMKQGPASGNVFYGMTLDEYDEYVWKFITKPSRNFTNLNHSEAFYLPMMEVISYLRNNGFTVYIISGTDRQILRSLFKGMIDIEPSQFIGAEFEYISSGNNDNDLYYVFQKEDKICRGNFVRKNTYINKVSNIAREIGKKPVLAFGNTMGDSGMLNYTLSENKYRSLSFCLIADDNEREFANTALSEKMTTACKKYGWIPISMRDDFFTIYGEDVRRKDPNRKIW